MYTQFSIGYKTLFILPNKYIANNDIINVLINNTLANTPQEKRDDDMENYDDDITNNLAKEGDVINTPEENVNTNNVDTGDVINTPEENFNTNNVDTGVTNIECEDVNTPEENDDMELNVDVNNTGDTLESSSTREQELINHINKFNLGLEIEVRTPAFGDCFYEAIINQAHILKIKCPKTVVALRKAILESIPDSPLYNAWMSLLFENNEENLKAFIRKHKKKNQYTDKEGLIILATVEYFKIPINIVCSNNNEKNPYTVHSPTTRVGDNEIWIGYMQDTSEEIDGQDGHFQSLAKNKRIFSILQRKRKMNQTVRQAKRTKTVESDPIYRKKLEEFSKKKKVLDEEFKKFKESLRKEARLLVKETTSTTII